jgi:UDP-N-acetylglucosamine--N-acetylmuramyl-(pentapeptide) pyrophosphoryl-undecaprenol N-acetylglucosamine transferase
VKEELEKLAQERKFEIEFLFVGHIDEMGQKLLDEHQITYQLVYAGKLRRYLSLDNLTDIIKGVRGFLLAQWYIWKFMPDVTFGKGGYASVPGVIVSWMYQVPIVIHESDSIPGLANRLLSRFATIIAIAFPGVKQSFPVQKTTLVGNMTRSDIAQGNKEQAREILKVTFEKPVILVIGGSQGAQNINKMIWGMLRELTRKVEVIHIVGMNNVREAETVYRSLDTIESRFYHYRGFMTDELKHAYAAADIIVSRSGASSIADIALNRKPSILIPITVDAGQQRSNAYEMAEIGASVVMEEQNLAPHLFLAEIEELLGDPQILASMGERAARFATPDAAKYLAAEILEVSN